MVDRDMELGLQGQRVVHETAGYGITLLTDAGYEICIESDLSMRTPEGDFDYSIGASILHPEEIHSLLHQTVTSSEADGSGALILSFDDGATLKVEPNDDYEAWTLAGPHGVKLVCMPGGELARWPDSGE
jgi:hypothetical protein